MKILFLCLHRPKRSPSQRYRFEQYLDFLESEGFECQQSFLLNQEEDRFYYQPGQYLKKLLLVTRSAIKRWKEIRTAHQYDVIYVQRECFMLGTAYFENAFAKKAPLVFDLDDSIWMHQTGNIRSGNKALYFLKNPEKTFQIAKGAKMVAAGNAYIKESLLPHNNNIRIIPTTIDTDKYVKLPLANKKDGICIGWSGSFSTIIHFEHAIPALLKIKEKYGDKVWFKVIGDANFHYAPLNIKGVAWTEETEIASLSEIDIGIMPLPDDDWTKGKCGLKGLAYMSLGIPTIMSPVGVNTDIITHDKNGLLASTEAEWVQCISELIEKETKRDVLGKEGRKTVEQRYSVNANKALYLSMFKDLIAKK